MEALWRQKDPCEETLLQGTSAEVPSCLLHTSVFHQSLRPQIHPLGLLGIIIIHRRMKAEGSRRYGEKKNCRCEVITCLFFYLPALRLPFVSHHLWHDDELSAVSPDQKGDPGVGDTLTRYACSPSWIMEQGLHLNDKQNDLETLQGSLAPAPPCLHAKKSWLLCKTRRLGFFWYPANSSAYLQGMLDNYESEEVTPPC